MATPESPAAWGYLWLDRIVGAVTGYLAYRAQVTRCFFARPRLGHIWEGNSLERRCSRCPKVWIGNL